MLSDNLKYRVEQIVAQIPKGRVMTYGQLAAIAGSPRAARIVGGVAHYGDPSLPWHRVVNKKGGLASGYHGGRHTQKEHLEAEGVEVLGEAGTYYVYIDSLIWWPEQASMRYGERMTEDWTKTSPSAYRRSLYPKSILFIVGPTASGKSSLAMEVARRLNGEIICADSQTVRRGMDIGTAKSTKAERAEIAHHLLDVIDPYERFTVSDFQQLAELAVKEIKSRGKLPIVVGGTGLYIDALAYGFKLRADADMDNRKVLDQKSVEQLKEIINERGLELPENDQNPRHLIRVIETDGQKSEKGKLKEGAMFVGLDPGKEELKKRIEKRSMVCLATVWKQRLAMLYRSTDHPRVHGMR